VKRLKSEELFVTLRTSILRYREKDWLVFCTFFVIWRLPYVVWHRVIKGHVVTAITNRWAGTCFLRTSDSFPEGEIANLNRLQPHFHSWNFTSLLSRSLRTMKKIYGKKVESNMEIELRIIFKLFWLTGSLSYIFPYLF